MNARLDYSPIPVGKVLPNHARTFIPVLEPARAQPCYEGHDDCGDWAVAQADKFAAVQAAEAAHDLEEVKHDLRVEWQFAIDNQHQLSTPKLPTVVADKLVMVPVTELVGTLMETCSAVELLCEALRTGDLTRLHLQLRMDWLDGNAQELAELGWQP